MKIIILSITALFLCLSNVAAYADQEALSKALASDIRSDKDKARDSSRKPAETLAFFEVNADSKVLELMPGGGWYTKILGNYLRDEGELYVAIGAREGRLGLKANNLEHVKIIGTDFELNNTGKRGIFDAKGSSFGVEGLDVALTFRNVHNLSEQGRAVINKAVYEALKPGGIYGIIDHTKRHMEADSDDLWRREDPVQIIKETLQQGFEFVDYSTIHARPDDKLIYDSTHSSIDRDSDRFTLKFRKPE